MQRLPSIRLLLTVSARRTHLIFSLTSWIFIFQLFIYFPFRTLTFISSPRDIIYCFFIISPHCLLYIPSLHNWLSSLSSIAQCIDCAAKFILLRLLMVPLALSDILKHTHKNNPDHAALVAALAGSARSCRTSTRTSARPRASCRCSTSTTTSTSARLVLRLHYNAYLLPTEIGYAGAVATK